MNKGDKVKWLDGIGFEHTGIVDRDTDPDEFMIPVRTNDDRILRIRYLDLTLIEPAEAKKEICPCGFPQSHPIPHEHDRTEREKQIIAHYEEINKGMYKALKALITGLHTLFFKQFEKDGTIPFIEGYAEAVETLAKAEEK